MRALILPSFLCQSRKSYKWDLYIPVCILIFMCGHKALSCVRESRKIVKKTKLPIQISKRPITVGDTRYAEQSLETTIPFVSISISKNLPHRRRRRSYLQCHWGARARGQSRRCGQRDSSRADWSSRAYESLFICVAETARERNTWRASDSRHYIPRCAVLFPREVVKCKSPHATRQETVEGSIGVCLWVSGLYVDMRSGSTG